MRLRVRKSAPVRRAPMYNDIIFRLRKCSVGNGRKLIVNPRIALIVRFLLLGTLDPGIRRLPSPLALPISLAHKNGAEGRDGSHKKRDTGFQGLPEGLPYHANPARRWDFGYTDDRDHDHHDRKTQKEAQPKFLTLLNFRSSKDDQGNADNLFSV